MKQENQHKTLPFADAAKPQGKPLQQQQQQQQVCAAIQAERDRQAQQQSCQI